MLLQAACATIAFAQDTLVRPPGSKETVRRVPVTPELERTAYADARARTLLARARTARIAQDSSLRDYDARTLQRVTIGLEVKRFGVGRTLLRTENSAHVQWSRGAGLWIEPTGRRAVSPMIKEARIDMDVTAATPIPYFPGRESLWLPSSYASVAQVEVNEEDLLHPLATGAESYYRYATGDSISIKLPEGRTIALRELRITARRPQWRAFVGSFWFDVDQGHLVRAVYRLATEIDFWKMASEEQRREIEALEEVVRTDTGEVARRAREALGGKAVEGASALIKGVVTSLRGSVSAVTVEYGLYEGRFWLPRLNIAEGEIQASFLRMPIRIEESFRYGAVNGEASFARIPTPGELALSGVDTTTSVHLTIGAGRPRQGVEDLIDAAARQIAHRAESCAKDSSYVTSANTRYGGALRVAVRMPCDTMRLVNSPDLPPSIYEPAEEFFGSSADRDEFLKSLSLDLQSGWGPQRPTLHTGLDLVRYNRIEGLSVGASATSILGFGYSAQAVARFGFADLVPNGELTVARSNGRAELRLGAFHRLAVANDDWGSPLSFGASVANLLFGRDEGFYYRAWGTELSGLRDAPGALNGALLQWRLFAERQRTAHRESNTEFSLAHVIGDRVFAANIDAPSVTALGASGELSRSFGIDPTRFRLVTRTRTEAAFTTGNDASGNGGYGRLLTSATASRGLGVLAASITGAAGAAAGELTPQRAFYVGGLHTVRGQAARADAPGYVGDAMWLARGELGLNIVAAKPVVFYDIGWAGRRADFGHPGRPLSGAGIGLSFLDGLVRTDLSKGIAPEQYWRLDLHLDALF